jgi:ubiquinone/menaquinone biosynthesis C-methylase UbiE
MAKLSLDQVAEKWDAIASEYEKAFEGLSSQYAVDVLTLLDLKPGDRVIDVAAGTC